MDCGLLSLIVVLLGVVLYLCGGLLYTDVTVVYALVSFVAGTNMLALPTICGVVGLAQPIDLSGLLQGIMFWAFNIAAVIGLPVSLLIVASDLWFKLAKKNTNRPWYGIRLLLIAVVGIIGVGLMVRVWKLTGAC